MQQAMAARLYLWVNWKGEHAPTCSADNSLAKAKISPGMTDVGG